MPKFESLSSRMKFYESLSGKQLMPLLPAIVRLDGSNFHAFTKGLDKPFDLNLINLMVETAIYLVEETNALIAYAQSDEISLVLYSDKFDVEIYYDGRTDKINSLLAARCSSFFTDKLPEYLQSKVGKRPVFDCRCFNVPTEMEAVNALLWREQDATRNSIQMAGQSQFSHKQLHERSCNDIQEMLWKEKNINWNDYPNKCKRGTYVQRVRTVRKFTTEELDKLPPKHEARLDPDLMVERNQVMVLDLPPITKITNIKDVIFRGAKYQVVTQS